MCILWVYIGVSGGGAGVAWAPPLKELGSKCCPEENFEKCKKKLLQKRKKVRRGGYFAEKLLKGRSEEHIFWVARRGKKAPPKLQNHDTWVWMCISLEIPSYIEYNQRYIQFRGDVFRDYSRHNILAIICNSIISWYLFWWQYHQTIWRYTTTRMVTFDPLVTSYIDDTRRSEVITWESEVLRNSMTSLKGQ